MNKDCGLGYYCVYSIGNSVSFQIEGGRIPIILTIVWGVLQISSCIPGVQLLVQ